MKIFEQFKNLDQSKSTLPLLVFDIETVRCVDVLPESGPLFEAWKYQRRKEDDGTYEQLALSFSTTAPLYAPFAKVVAASFGYYKGGEVFIKSFSGLDEKELLIELSTFLNSDSVMENFSLSGLAISGYDIPILAKRCLSNGLPIPEILDNSTKKPWEVNIYDLNPILKMNGFYQESLVTSCYLLGVDSPKTNNVDGSQVSDIFYGKGKDKAKLAMIAAYCNEDVHATLNCFLRLLGFDIVQEYKVK